MKVQIEEVSPEMAKQWLALSKGNRKINENFVLSLAVAMEQGKWIPEASEVVFDVDGALVDGHHRLTAVGVHDKPVKMAVKRGVPAEVRNVIDTGRTRSMGDLLGMYRSVDYATSRRAALNMCVYLLVGVGVGARRQPQIRTLDAFDAWMRHFKDGIDWAVSATYGTGAPAVAARAFITAPVLGAFAFAHRLNPDGVSKFHTAAIMGEGLKAADPALTLRNFVLLGYNGHAKTGRAVTGRREIAVKTLSAIKADLEGGKMAKLQSNSYALPFFRAAYVEPWETPEVAQKSEAV